MALEQPAGSHSLAAADSLPASWREVLIQAVDGGLVAVRLGVAVGVGRLGDRRMAELVLRPPEVSAGLQEPRGERVAGRVVFPIG